MPLHSFAASEDKVCLKRGSFVRVDLFYNPSTEEWEVKKGGSTIPVKG